MSSYLMTQTLLSAWQYIYQAREGNEEEAYLDFLRVLNREPAEPTEAMRAGIGFEDAVTAYLNGDDAEGTVRTVGDLIRGAQLQVAVSKGKTVAGTDFLLYGRLDALRAGVIYDIKYSKTYETGKYLNSPQHPMYLELVPEAREFQYVVSDGRDVFIERYTRRDAEPIEKTIGQFMEFLASYELSGTYYAKWESK